MKFHEYFSTHSLGFCNVAKDENLKVFEFDDLFRKDAGYAGEYKIYVLSESYEQAQERFDLFVEKLMDIEDKYNIIIPDDINIENCAEDGSETVVCIKGITKCHCGEYLIPCRYCQDVSENELDGIDMTHAYEQHFIGRDCRNCEACKRIDNGNVKKYDFTEEEIDLMYLYV
jgi:hypothetical protein